MGAFLLKFTTFLVFNAVILKCSLSLNQSECLEQTIYLNNDKVVIFVFNKVIKYYNKIFWFSILN